MDIGIMSIGTVLNVIGSVLLAVRVKMLLKWIGLVLDAHEMSIVALTDLIERANSRMSPDTHHVAGTHTTRYIKMLRGGFATD